jgi:hypothetical protein
MGTAPSLSRDWEEVFSSWGAPPGETEQTKCENAVRAVRKAIASSAKLQQHEIEVFVQGSYANRTNVRKDSDVDVCVLEKDVFFTDYSLSEGLNDALMKYEPARYSYGEFKNDVETALRACFGTDRVTRGNKAFDVHANTYHIDADVVPCLEHRRVKGNAQNNSIEFGTELCPDNGGRIINWPAQNYRNGVNKNTATGRRFKALVRILKRLRNEMVDNGHAVAQPIPSFLIECLCWNVPTDHFGNETYSGDLRNAILYLWNETCSEEKCKEWGEVNELKYLFRLPQPWTREQVNSFLVAAWAYVGFK